MEEMTRVERKKLAARTRILEAAEELFLREDGYGKTTIKDIAELADVSTGSVYMHFIGKADIMAGLLEQILADSIANLPTSAPGQKSGIEQIEDYINYFFYIAAHSKFLAYLHYIERIEPSEISPQALESLQKCGERILVFMQKAIERGQADGSVKKLGSPDLLTFVITHSIMSFARDITWHSERRPHPPQISGEKAMELLRKLLISAVAKKTGGG